MIKYNKKTFLPLLFTFFILLNACDNKIDYSRSDDFTNPNILLNNIPINLRLNNLKEDEKLLVEILIEQRNFSIFERSIDYDTVREIKLTSNKIPTSISKLINLQDISITVNEKLDFKTEELKLKNLFSNLLTIKTLSSITLENIHNIPKEVFQIKTLKKLYIKSDYLSVIPKEISNLTSLQNMSLETKNLVSIPKEIKKLNYLKFLTISSSMLKELPRELFELEFLSSLTIKNTIIESLPESFNSDSNLLSVEFHNNKNLKELPNSMSNLSYLNSLTVENSSLTKLPSSFSNLKSLTILNLKNNLLEEFPKELFSMPTLTDIYLANNKITSIPLEILNILKLNTLNLENNNIKAIPKEITESNSYLKIKI